MRSLFTHHNTHTHQLLDLRITFVLMYILVLLCSFVLSSALPPDKTSSSRNVQSRSLARSGENDASASATSRTANLDLNGNETTICYDYPGWISTGTYYSVPCSWYNDVNDDYDNYDYCDLYGDVYPDDNGVDANEACCVCGGGSLDDNSCTDYTGWTDGDNYSCSWYSNDFFYNFYCESYGHYLDENEVDANEACCICGGGYLDGNPVPSFSPSISLHPTHSAIPSFSPSISLHPTTVYSSECKDFEFWYDLDGYEFNCEYYRDDPYACKMYGGGYANFGHTARTACCTCSDEEVGATGGYAISKVIVEPPILKKAEEVEGLCFDYYNWSVAANDWTCSNYTKDDDYNGGKTTKCGSFGHFISKAGISASSACCECDGGERVRQSVVIRAGYPDDSIDGFSLTTLMDNVTRNGTFDFFAKEAARSHGFGLVYKDISEEAKEVYPDDSYLACMYGKLLVGR